MHCCVDPVTANRRVRLNTFRVRKLHTCTIIMPSWVKHAAICPDDQTLWHLAVPKVFCMTGFQRITHDRNVGAWHPD